MSREHIHFVTGRLAQHALEEILQEISVDAGFDFSIDVLPITVAALMTPEWIAKHINVPSAASRVLVPGYCPAELEALQSVVAVPIARGPKDYRELPEFFSLAPLESDYGRWDIEIIAEINNCPQLTLAEIQQTATALVQDGADVIDIGCEPDGCWSEVGDAVRALTAQGYRVSIDSLNPWEIELAVRAGAELVLSVNSSNREAAADWGVEVVAIPDDPTDADRSLDETVDLLAQAGVPLRIDPVLEPIGFGFAQSLGRYLDVRRRYPDAELMMGIGNLTELSEVDSAGVNLLLLGYCQELAIRSVLTTQVINWTRSSVRECCAARQLVFHAVNRRVLPKHLDPSLVMLRDEKVLEADQEEIARLADAVRDANYRVFASGGEVHLVSRGLHLHDADPFVVMEQLRQSGPERGLPKNLDASHAFYLGYEMCQAYTASLLGKTYRQDESLDWGLATGEQPRHYLHHRRGEDAQA